MRATSLFTAADFPEHVFREAITSCAWFSMDALCCVDGWSLVSALARQHGDVTVEMIGLDLLEPELVTLPVNAGEDAYGALCRDELLAPNVIRWWGPSGRWGIHGSRGSEVAVAGQVDAVHWPSSQCGLLSIDSAMRLVRRAGMSDDVRAQMIATYDALSWDPAIGNESALPELVDACRAVLADRIDPVVGIRMIVDLIDVAPRQIRRIPATERLHAAWRRTGYLVLGSDREQFGSTFGSGLLAQNDRNHERHAAEEGAIVRRAAEEILSAIERTK